MWHLLTVAFAALPQQAARPADTLVVRDHDISGLRTQDSSPQLRFELGRVFDTFDGPWHAQTALRFEESSSGISPEEWAEIFYAGWEHVWETEGTELYIVSDYNGAANMRVKAPESTQQEIAQAVSGLQSLIANASTRVVLEVFDASSDPAAAETALASSVLDAAGVEALRAQFPAQRFESDATYGTWQASSSGRRIEAIARYSVEIAANAFGYRAEPIAVLEGLRSALMVTQVPGGHWVNLALQHTHGLDGPTPREFDLGGVMGGSEGVPPRDVSLPLEVDDLDVGLTSAAFDAHVPAGKSLIFGARSSSEGQSTFYLYTLTLGGDGRDSQATYEIETRDRRVRLFDTGAASMPGWEGLFERDPLLMAYLDEEEAMVGRGGSTGIVEEMLDMNYLGGFAWEALRLPLDPEEQQRSNEKLEGLRRELQRRAVVAPMAQVAGRLGEGFESALWLPAAPSRRVFGMAGRVRLQHQSRELEVASGSLAHTLDAYTRRFGVAVGLRTQTLGALTSVEAQVYSRFPEAVHARGFVRAGNDESRLIDDRGSQFDGSIVLDPTGPARVIAGGGSGPVIELQVR